MSNTETRTNGSRVPPNDLHAEAALLGAMLLSGQAIADVIDLCTAEDFYQPSHTHIFDVVTWLYRSGEPADAVTVADRLRAMDLLETVGGPAILSGLQTNTPAISNAVRYARLVAEHAARRRLAAAALEARNLAYDLSRTAEDALEASQGLLAAIVTPTVRVPPGVHAIDDYVYDPPHEVRRPWLIPGLLRYGWRVMMVAAEGSGKTTLARQLAICAAQGIHPLAFSTITPVRTLIVDLENPPDPIYETCKMITDRARSAKGDGYEPGRAWLWTMPGGINIRTRTDRARLEAVIASVRPDLVCLGPLYQTFRKGRDNDEEAAVEAAQVLDALRTRYDFALVIEHHAPKAQNNQRDLNPFGSAVWLRWPELGLKLKAPGKGDPENSLVLGRFRKDRVKCNWPDRLDRGTTGWAWEGRWSGPYGIEEPQPVLEEQF